MLDSWIVSHTTFLHDIVFFLTSLAWAQSLQALYMKDRKRWPEGGDWEPQISFETFDRCPKINPKRHTNKSDENSSHQELRDPKDVPQITRNPTQKTELELEIKRARNESQQHKLRATDCPLEYRGQSATVLYSPFRWRLRGTPPCGFSNMENHLPQRWEVVLSH
jgi:hypothetical protein